MPPRRRMSSNVIVIVKSETDTHLFMPVAAHRQTNGIHFTKSSVCLNVCLASTTMQVAADSQTNEIQFLSVVELTCDVCRPTGRRSRQNQKSKENLL